MTLVSHLNYSRMEQILNKTPVTKAYFDDTVAYLTCFEEISSSSDTYNPSEGFVRLTGTNT